MHESNSDKDHLAIAVKKLEEYEKKDKNLMPCHKQSKY